MPVFGLWRPLAIWFAERGNSAFFSLYFKQESDQERGQRRIFGRLICWSGQPVRPSMPSTSPPELGNSLEEVLRRCIPD